MFDVRGLWNNELSLLSPIYRNGGEIDLVARALGSELTIGDDVRLLASGGASLSAAGGHGWARWKHRLARGVRRRRHGTWRPGRVVRIRRGRCARRYFAFEAPRLEIADGALWAVSQRLDVAAEDAGFVTLGDALFTGFGFSNFDLVATGPRDEDVLDTLVVRDGAEVEAVTRTLVLADGLAARLSGGTVDAFSRATLAPDHLRFATSVSLRAEARDFTGPDAADSVGRLAIERDATIRVEPRGTVSMSAVGGINIGGRIAAPGGTVSATIPTPSIAVDGGYREDVGIEVTDTARLNLAGIALLRPNDAGLLQGDVLAGGSLNLLANRGFVDVARGADIDIGGTSSDIDVPGTGVAGGFQRRHIASAAGSITLRAPESLSFQGTLHAQGGAGDTPAAGGTATYQLTRQRGFEPLLLLETYPTGRARYW